MHKIDIVAIIEAKVEAKKANSYRIKLGFDQIFKDEHGNWIFLGRDIKASIVTSTGQEISLKVTHPEVSKDFILSIVHGGTTKKKRRDLWEALLAIDSMELPWIVGRNFNAITNLQEQSGRNAAEAGSIFEFNQFIFEGNLQQLPFAGNEYTWDNIQEGSRNQQSWLDMILSNQHWLDLTYSSSVTHLNRFESDHTPLMLEIATSKPFIHKSFKFQRF